MMKSTKLLLSLIIVVTALSACGEREGVVKTSDCREKITIKENSFEALTKTFTCQYYKTRQGRIMGGNCVHIEYDNNGQCKASYTYYKEQDNVCLDKANPRLREDDMCYPY